LVSTVPSLWCFKRRSSFETGFLLSVQNAKGIASLWLSGCTQEEKYPFFPEKGYDSGTVIPIKISMAENGEYDSYTPENDMPPRYNAPLIAEWAGVQTLSRTRTKRISGI